MVGACTRSVPSPWRYLCQYLADRSVVAEVFKVLLIFDQTIGKSLLNTFPQAYVGGLYKEQGLDVVGKWLRSLLQLDIKEAYEIVQREYLLPPL